MNVWLGFDGLTWLLSRKELRWHTDWRYSGGGFLYEPWMREPVMRKARKDLQGRVYLQTWWLLFEQLDLDKVDALIGESQRKDARPGTIVRLKLEVSEASKAALDGEEEA